MEDEKKEGVQDIKSEKPEYESLIIIYQNKKDGSIGVTGAPDVIKASTTCAHLFGHALIALAQKHIEKGKFNIDLRKGMRKFQKIDEKMKFAMFLGKCFKGKRR